MEIRELNESELPEALILYENARAFMRRIGNETQWRSGWPPESVLKEDIEKHRLYGVFEDGKLRAVFAYWFGRNAEPSYCEIDGKWPDNEAYGVIHRIAAAEGSGAGKAALREGIEKSGGHLRIDTHEDNKAMRHVLESMGFRHCGIIYLPDGSPRHAYAYSSER